MKTEDLKNYIFEQLTETSDALKRKLLDARFKQSMRAHDAGFDISHENQKIFKKTGTFDPSLTAARDVMGNRAVKAGKSYLKTVNRINGLMGDGSLRTPTQESALNFINGLKRLNETSDAAAKNLQDARRQQMFQAANTSKQLAKTNHEIYKKTGKFDVNLLKARTIMVDKTMKAGDSFTKVSNRRHGLRGDGSPGKETITPQEVEDWIGGELRRIREVR